MGTVKVVHSWDDSMGQCGDCGDPAAFVSLYRYWNKTERPDSPPPVTENNKLCAVCAAQDACDGETIRRLFVDLDTEGEPDNEHLRALTDLGIDPYEDAKERSTCSVCLARTYRSEECICEDGGDAEEYPY